MRAQHRHLLVFAALAAAIGGSSTLSAAPYPGPESTPFYAMDTDKNGYVTEQEFNQYRAARQSMMAAQGRLLRNAASAPRFSQIDSDGDTNLTAEEMGTFHAKRMQQIMGAGAQTGLPGRGRGPCSQAIW